MISRRILAAVALLCALAPAQAQKTKAALTSEINTNWPDNVAGAITPAILRSTVIDIVNSYYDLNGTTSLACAAHQWVAGLPTLSSLTCSQPAIADISGWGTGVATALGNSLNAAGGLLGVGASAGGDLSGTLPNPIVAKLNGIALSGLASGILKNTTGTGAPSIAIKGTDYIAPGATMQALGASPTATGGTVMMGLGVACNLTPTVTGRVLINFNFTHANSGITTDTAQIKYGTGTAPANNVAATGTNLGSQRPMYEPTGTASMPVSISGLIVTGLTINTAYWFDILLGAGAGSASITGTDCSGQEF